MSTDSMMWSGPGRALDAHLDILGYVSKSVDYARRNEGKRLDWQNIPLTMLQRLGLMTSFSSKMEVSVDGQTVSTNREDVASIGSDYNIARTMGLLNVEYRTLDEGETHYVSHNVMASLEAAAASMDDEPLYATDIPSPAGLIVFEYPMLFPDLHPDTGALTPELIMPVRAIGWKTHSVSTRDPKTGELTPHDGIHYVQYTDAESFDKFFVTSTRKLLGDERAKKFARPQFLNGMADLHYWASDASAWAFATTWETGLGLEEEFGAGTVPVNVAMMRRWLLAYFRWTWQRIIVPQSYRPRKAEAKRAARAGKHLEDGYIKVLRLRREVEFEQRHGEPTEGFHFAYQWIVRGHWRRVWCKTLGPHHNEDGSFNNDSHRLTWIEPHLSGNPFGPLVSGHNVNAAVR